MGTVKPRLTRLSPPPGISAVPTKTSQSGGNSAAVNEVKRTNETCQFFGGVGQWKGGGGGYEELNL